MDAFFRPHAERIDGRDDDHGWHTEWTVNDAYRLPNGFPIYGAFTVIAGSQEDAALTARVHFVMLLTGRPINRG